MDNMELRARVRPYLNLAAEDTTLDKAVATGQARNDETYVLRWISFEAQAAKREAMQARAEAGEELDEDDRCPVCQGGAEDNHECDDCVREARAANWARQTSGAEW